MSLPITLAGSWPKPSALRRARRRFQEQEIDAAEFRQVEDAAIESTLRLQESHGISILTDGEIAREDLVAHYAGALDGLATGLLVRCWGNRYVRRPRVVAPIGRSCPFLVEPWQRVQAHTDRAVRAQVTGPYTLMHWSFDEHYGDRERCARAFAAVLGEEVEALAKAGAVEIQLDEPALGAAALENEWALKLIHEVGARSGSSRLWIRVGFGDPQPDWKTLAALRADRLVLDLAHQGLTASAGLADLPLELTLVAGVIDAIDAQVETTKQICGRIEELLERVPRERLMLTTDGGMRGLGESVAASKLERLAAAAALF